MIMIHKGTRLVGRLETGEPVCVAGRMEGVGICSDVVTIRAGGHWRGRIRARQVWVEGRVEGEIHADESVTLAAGARVNGLVRSPHLAIHGGAVCNAHLLMGEMGPEVNANGDSTATSAFRDCA